MKNKLKKKKKHTQLSTEKVLQNYPIPFLLYTNKYID